MNVRVELYRKLSAENWCFWTVVLEKTLESPLICKEIKPVHPKRNQSWKFVGKTDAEAETPILWPPDAKNWLLGKDPDAGKDWRQEKGMTEDEMVGWHHRLNGHEFEQALGVSDGQGGLVCCGPWSHKESDTTERPNWTDTEYQKSNAVNYKFVAAQGICHLPPRGLNPVLLQLLTFSTPRKESWLESEALCFRKTGGTGLWIVRCFQELILWSTSLHLLISRKALKPFMLTSSPCD